MEKPNNLEGRVKYLTRYKLSILLSEYCFLDIVYQLQSNPKSKVPGYCFASNQYFALHIGLSERGIQKIKARMIEINLLERHPKVQQYLRTTTVFYDVHVLGYDFDGTNSVRPSTNSVHVSDELSSFYIFSDIVSLIATTKEKIKSFVDLQFLIQARFKDDSLVARREIWMIVETLIDEQWFVDQWDYLAGTKKEKVAPKRKKIVKDWIDKSYWSHIKGFHFNKIATWISRAALNKGNNGKQQPTKTGEPKQPYKYSGGGWD